MTYARNMHEVALANTCETRLDRYRELRDLIYEKAALGEFCIVLNAFEPNDAAAMMSMARSEGFHAEWLGNSLTGSIVISW